MRRTSEEMDLFDQSMTEHLHSGCAVLVGTVDATGRPHASRGWGLTVLDAHAGHVRLLLDAADVVTLANVLPGAPVAITTASVPTLHSVQLKGRVLLVEPADEIDEAKRVQYARDFTHDIHHSDGDPMAMLMRWTDRHVVACVVEVDTSFDQTPGPTAGSLLAGGQG